MGQDKAIFVFQFLFPAPHPFTGIPITGIPTLDRVCGSMRQALAEAVGQPGDTLDPESAGYCGGTSG